MKNINCGRISKLFFLFFISWNVFAQTDSVRVMSYNLMLYPSGTTYSRDAYLSAILNDYRPDILAVCEIETQAAADNILNSVLIPINPSYASATFEPNHSNPNGTLQQMLYYNSEKLELYSETYLTTNIRDINRYTLYLKTQELTAGDTIFIDIYVMHLKASQGQTNEDKRLEMVQVLTQDLNNIPSNHYVLAAGDLNLYRSDEPAYLELTDTSNPIVLKDPVNRPGYWHNNSSFADLHTQSPNTNKGGNFVGGGLDDRFDFILISQNLTQPNQDLTYKTGSYAAYGNNGNCFNGNINSTSCAGNYSQTLRDNLYEMSDHIPVVLTLETNQHFTSVQTVDLKSIKIYPNPANEYLFFETEEQLNFYLSDLSGKIIKTNLDNADKKCYIGDLKPGIYYVQFQDKTYLPVRFIKN